ncbi:MAG: iron-sulfur cluster assembly accessory protein [Hyphomicrobium sp.]
MISLTDNAVLAVKKAIAKSGKDGAGFRIMIENGGCSGFKYKIGLDAAPRQDDEVVEAGDVKIFVDAQSKQLLDGLRVDFVEEIGRSGFSFDNPNAKSKCNCGKSFC